MNIFLNVKFFIFFIFSGKKEHFRPTIAKDCTSAPARRVARQYTSTWNLSVSARYAVVSEDHPYVLATRSQKTRQSARAHERWWSLSLSRVLASFASPG